MTALELLAQIEQKWYITHTDYRDHLLEIGRKLHEFVLLWLQEVDHLSEAERLAMGRSRHAAVKLAGEKLGIRHTDVSRYIGVAMAVDLLSDNGSIGRLCWGGLSLFYRFVERQCDHGKRDDTHPRNKDIPGRCGIPISLAETWVLREEYAERAKEIFRDVVACGRTYEAIRPAVLRLYTKPRASAKKRRRDKPEQLALETVGLSLRVASAGDAAEMLFDLLQKAEEPKVVIQRLNQLFEEHGKAKKRERYSLADVG